VFTEETVVFNNITVKLKSAVIEQFILKKRVPGQLAYNCFIFSIHYVGYEARSIVLL